MRQRRRRRRRPRAGRGRARAAGAPRLRSHRPRPAEYGQFEARAQGQQQRERGRRQGEILVDGPTCCCCCCCSTGGNQGPDDRGRGAPKDAHSHRSQRRPVRDDLRFLPTKAPAARLLSFYCCCCSCCFFFCLLLVVVVIATAATAPAAGATSSCRLIVLTNTLATISPHTLEYRLANGTIARRIEMNAVGPLKCLPIVPRIALQRQRGMTTGRHEEEEEE